MWLCIRYILSSLSVNTNVSCVWCCVLLPTIHDMVFSLALSMICNPGNLSTIQMLLVGQ